MTIKPFAVWIVIMVQKQLYKAIFCKIYPAAGWLYRDRQETVRTA